MPSPMLRLGVSTLLASVRVGAFDTISNLWSTVPVDSNVTNNDVVLEYRQSPCSGHEFYLTKAGVLQAQSSVVNETGFIYEYPDDVLFTWADHGALGMELHPDFPAQPYIFVFMSLEHTPPWNDQCLNLVDGMSLCLSEARLARFKLDIPPPPPGMNGTCPQIGFTASASNPYTLFEGLPSTSNTHGIGDIKFYGADLLLTSGDLSQANGEDYGFPSDDAFVPSMKYPQGRFRSQRMDFLNGKLWMIYADSLLKTTGRLVYGTDFDFVAIGLRQPYAMTVDNRTMHAYIGDVGSNMKEEINHLTPDDFAAFRETKIPLNFGWPCIEGTQYLSDSGAALDKTWIQGDCDPSTMLCDICKDIYPCATARGPGLDGCSATYRPPAYEYRHVTLDEAYPEDCTGASSSITALAVFHGDNPLFGATGTSFMPNNLVAADYGTGCMWYFHSDANGVPLFQEGAQLLAINFFTATLGAARDGYLYSSSITRPFNLFRHGINLNDDPPAARLTASVKNAATGSFDVCESTCQISVGGTIQLDASASTAGGAAIASYTFDFQSGQITQATPIATRTYNTGGIRYVSVTVTDTANKTSTASWVVLVGRSVGITMSPPTGQWKLGDTISYSLQLSGAGVATAAVEGTAAVSHCYPNLCTGVDDCHTHPWNMDDGYATKAIGKITPPEHDMPSTMSLLFTIKPANSAPFDVSFRTQCLQYYATLQATVSGVTKWWPITSGELTPCVPPCVKPYMAKNAALLSANQYQADYLGKIYKILNWTGAYQSGTVTVGTGSSVAPVISEDGITFSAKYVDALAAAPDNSSAAPPALVGLNGSYGALELAWELPPSAARAFDWVVVSVRTAAAPISDYSSTYQASGATTVTLQVPVGAADYIVALAGYSSSSNTRTIWGPSYTVTSSADSARRLCAYTPYGPYPAGSDRPSLPGSVEIEQYAVGGSGFGFFDNTFANDADRAAYLRRDSVDIKKNLNAVSGFGYVVAEGFGEWLAYPVTVSQTGFYDVTYVFSATSGNTDRTLKLMLDRADCATSAALAVSVIPATAPQDVLSTLVAGSLWLTAGEHTLRVCTDLRNGALLLDRMNFALSASQTQRPTAAPTPAKPTPPTQMPTLKKTRKPTSATTSAPTAVPTSAPSLGKTASPSSSTPTLLPISRQPTMAPSMAPTMPTPKPTPKATRQPTFASDSDILLSLKAWASGGDPTSICVANWTSTQPLSQWAGVKVATDGHVAKLRLIDCGITGTLPADIGKLLFLTRLDVSGNMLTGSVPCQYKQLANLDTMDLVQKNGFGITGCPSGTCVFDTTTATQSFLAGLPAC